jgi:hypothetical protein
MKKQILLYNHLTEISSKIPMWMASRPENENTYDTFSREIEKIRAINEPMMRRFGYW